MGDLLVITMQHYNFPPVGPFALKISADNTASNYGGKVIEMGSLYGNGYYVVPLDHPEVP
jgi:hypothetical protein